MTASSARIAGLPIRSSLIAAPSASKRMFGLIWGDTKVGKTLVAAGLDAVTQEHLGKRTLIVACEQAAGSGLDRVAHLDIPTVELRDTPTVAAFDALLRLVDDNAVPQQFGGVLLDGLSELALHSVQHTVLDRVKRPSLSGDDKAMRDFGAMIERDYVPFQEAIRKIMSGLARLNAKGVHVLITAGMRQYSHREKGSSESILDKVGPAFPGSGSIRTVETIVPTIFEVTQDWHQPDPKGPRVLGAFLETARSGKHLRGDRTGLFPDKALAIVNDDQGRPVSNLPAIFREHWLPAASAAQNATSPEPVRT